MNKSTQFLFFIFFSILFVNISYGQESPVVSDSTTADKVGSEAKKLDHKSSEFKSKIGHETLIRELLLRLTSPDTRTRIESGIALKETATEEDVETLVEELKKGNNSDKQLALIETLAFLKDKRAGEALRFEIRHGDPDTKRAAITALGKLKFDWPIPILVRTLRQSEDEEERKRAASALGEIGSNQAIYALRTSLATLEKNVGAKNAVFWALEVARNEVDPKRIDLEMPEGRRLELFYKGMRYFYYTPAQRRKSGSSKVGLNPWLLVCIHDSDLRVDDIFNICWRAGKKRQMAVLVPFFDPITYPEYGNFNVRSNRSDKALLELIEHLGKQSYVNVREFYLFGYGQGGDFTQRFSMAYPQRIAKAAFESDNFTKPDNEIFFPLGLNRNPLANDISIDMYKFLKSDTMIVFRKNSPVFRESKEYYEAINHFSDVAGLRNRIAVRTVDVQFEVWSEAEKYLFSYE